MTLSDIKGLFGKRFLVILFKCHENTKIIVKIYVVEFKQQKLLSTKWPQLAQLVLSSSSFSYLFSTLFLLPLGTRTDQVGGLREPGPAGPNILYIYIYIVIIYFIYVMGPFQNLRYSFSLISLTNLTKLATIQPKKLTKIIKTFIIVIVF